MSVPTKTRNFPLDILLSVTVNLFSEFIGDDRTPATIASYGSFCIIYNRAINPNNFKIAQFSIVFHL
ncbi:MAG: hypothetical protein EAZ60_26590 [Oscillatoriales cyanobacterium]|nr:MAG: hypothetical protein EAZ83_28250 [Oscillatoriales cyanobacterium]TAE93487.1 MAG: hypothetical protein EAZ79_27365 [Oscillatoriales cyanobacterium]TAF14691.1 MAG: hypothetical protein EAZ73_28465 [Oscillatoriales cyanobacterium]TAF26322.1 MAG: hypothetical protein EAZ69_29310 [Oscillatoriales cyanobacterium]TAF51237.1 MAG: hypothetical protein EAZ60_26590 [Oscillatoriales cyanobacterium]